jgi:ADP-heptose:LPS heptosyltransferase
LPVLTLSSWGVARALRQGGRHLATTTLELAVRGAASLSPALPVAPQPPRSIFVLRNNDIGDLLAITPLFEALRRHFPETSVAAGVGSWNLPVLQHNPYVSEVLAINAPWFNKYHDRRAPWRPLLYLWRSPEARELARRRFEVGIDVLGSGWGSLLMLRAGIPYRLGVRGYAGGDSAVQAAVTFDPSEHVGRSALRFAELLGATRLPPCRPQLFLTAEEAAAGERWWAAAAGGSRRSRVVIGPGAGLAAKRWPAESFVALAAGLAAPGELSLLALGSATEGDLVAAVALAARGCGHAETPSLRRVFALVAASDLVVCNSSMLLHVAAGFGKPTVVLLGRAFHSASLHQAQWGYPGISQSLGREPGQREDVCTPAAALMVVREQLAKLAARSPRR